MPPWKTTPATRRKPAAKRPPARLTVAGALRAELAEIAKRDRALANGALAASALALAEQMDEAKVSAAAKSQCARALRETLDRIHELAPPEEAGDALDEIAARRDRRRARAAGSA